MFKRVGAIGVMGAAIAVVVATALSGTASARVAAGTRRPSRAAARSRSASPIRQTGPAASIGALQYDWAQFARDQVEREPPGEDQARQGRHAARHRHVAVAIAVAHVVREQRCDGRGRRSGREPGDAGHGTIWQGAGLAPISGSATACRAHARRCPGPRETTPGYFFRTVPNDGQQGDNVANYIHNEAAQDEGRDHRRRRGVQQGLRDQSKADLKDFGVDGQHEQHQPVRHELLGGHHHDPVGHAARSTSRGSSPRRRRTSTPSCTRPVRTDHVFGSDGTDDPATFKGAGSYVSGFPSTRRTRP